MVQHRMTDEEFAEFCSEHPYLLLEMTAEQEVIVMAPNFTLTGFRNSNINRQLAAWAEQDGRGKWAIPPPAMFSPTAPADLPTSPG